MVLGASQPIVIGAAARTATPQPTVRRRISARARKSRRRRARLRSYRRSLGATLS